MFILIPAGIAAGSTFYSSIYVLLNFSMQLEIVLHVTLGGSRS